MSTTETVFPLGGRGPLKAHLAAANGLPPQAYAPLAAELGEQLTLYATLPLAMRSDAPPPSRLSWGTLADDMARQLLAAGLRHLVGLGHSLGGTLTVMAAARYPDLFDALVLLEPVIFPTRYLVPFGVLRLLGLHHRFPLAARARRRRAAFPSREAAAAHLRSRPFFRRWHPDAFAAYIRHGLVPDESTGGVRLAYPPAWEAAIFANPPAEVWPLARRVRLPTLIVIAGVGSVLHPAARRRLQRLWPHARMVTLAEGGHMFPVEAPAATAALLREWLSQTALPAR